MCFDGGMENTETQITCEQLQKVIARSLRGSMLAMSKYFDTKAAELSCMLKLIGDEENPKMDDEIAGILFTLFGTIVGACDLERVKKNIRPCGHKTCDCHETKAVVLQTLIMIKQYAETKASQPDSAISVAHL